MRQLCYVLLHGIAKNRTNWYKYNSQEYTKICISNSTYDIDSMLKRLAIETLYDDVLTLKAIGNNPLTLGMCSPCLRL